ncbi:AraC family transcriptional regulator [Streptomyces sp. Ru73]|uniref:helix-turn-helix transcriptional regulator n=1 Tax=Streptomyces sp. Ru73 TaxID=2080748 RepID=UPI000CDDB754|nr:helix-turn-helix transcriptional regulator [Streptomyces sp. Ru73]POX37719.1 AraC family transcriptional regulator [Streptomyces sp. Ru73]
MMTRRFDSDSLEETEAFLAAAYTRLRFSSSARKPRTQIIQTTAGQLSVDRCVGNYDTAYSSEGPGKVCLVDLHEGRIAVRSGRREEAFVPGDTFLLMEPDRPYNGTTRAARLTLALFDPALLSQVAATSAAHRSGPVRLTGQRPATAHAKRQLQATIAFLRDDVLADPAAHTAPLAIANATRLLAASALAALPNTATTDTARADSRDGSPSTLRRAITFIEGNAHRDISLADIAASIPVTPRALQYAFRRHAGTTPLGYLRSVRLAHAHTDLKAAAPHEGATVTAIAMRWGFTHPGRFSALYKSAYGLPPSATLRS